MKRNSLLAWILFLIALYTINCDRIFDSILSPTKNCTVPNQQLTLGDTLGIAYQDTLFNCEEDIWISFDSLVADSRCPIGVVCIWEGNAEVSLTFDSTRFHLNTYPNFRTDTTISSFHIDLIDVQPYLHIDSLYTDEQYSVAIRVTR